MKLCNYNSFDINYAPAKSDGEERNVFEFWYTRPGQFGKANRLNIVGNGFSDNILSAGACETLQGSVSIETRIATFYMRALLNGPREDGVSKAYCNAFAFNPIALTYDYGDGKCDVSVSSNN
jgi:hypothetical protein